MSHHRHSQVSPSILPFHLLFVFYPSSPPFLLHRHRIWSSLWLQTFRLLPSSFAAGTMRISHQFSIYHMSCFRSDILGKLHVVSRRVRVRGWSQAVGRGGLCHVALGMFFPLRLIFMLTMLKNNTARPWIVGYRRKCLCDDATASCSIETSVYATPFFLPSFLPESRCTY